MRGIVKVFPGVVANDHVDLDIYPKEVVALLGENGAGKTTLMNILYGLYQPDEGTIKVRGRVVRFRSPRDAINNGIGMVHQHFTLVDDMTVSENVILGLRRYGIFPNMRKASQDILRLAKEIGFNISPDAYIWQLSAGEKQKVEILKALFRNINVLILDEPTSVLTPQEAEELFNTIRRLKAKGLGVVFISHKLQEVMEIADRIVVLRKGKVVGRLKVSEANPRLLARLMVGREVFLQIQKPPARLGPPYLEIKNLSVMGDKGLLAVKNVTFSIRGGEILGVAAVAGNGQKELSEAIYGLRKAVNGRIMIKGEDLTYAGIAERIKKGVALIPEERLRYGCLPRFRVADNLIIERIDDEPFSRRVRLITDSLALREIDDDAIENFAKEVISKYNIYPPNPSLAAGKLSGGNLQKVMVARELERGSDIILAVEPTAGLDIAATEHVRNLLVDARNKGKALLLVSSDLSEVLSLSDKVMVMYEGEIVGVFRPCELSIEEIGLMMAGAKRMPREVISQAWATS
jgi:ABC-type uncharacterized transport system ATPase subunit